MGAYLQIGHEGWNLLDDPILFKGIILSPVNDAPITTSERLQRLGNRRSQLDVVFDPQLYNPNSNRGHLPLWDYFPDDLETADLSDTDWWFRINQSVAACAAQLQCNVVCSPAYVPRTYSQDYYSQVVSVADDLLLRAAPAGIETAATLIVRLSDLHPATRALEIASIVSSTRAPRIYLVLVVEGVEPRRQLVGDTQLISNAVHLVRLLARHLRVQMAFCAQDLVLWKAAGAQDASTGKFLNLRRFSPTRWTDDHEARGRQTAYWSEPSLLTLLRDADVLNLRNRGLYNDGIQIGANPYSQQILNLLARGSGDPWVRFSWRQYLHWFVNTEARLTSPAAVHTELAYVSATWDWLRSQGIQLLDDWNDGSWVPVWTAALGDGLSR